MLLSRKLSRGKWLALTLLTIAAVSQLTSTSDHLFEGRSAALLPWSVFLCDDGRVHGGVHEGK